MEDFALGAALEAAPLVVVRETFGDGALSFTVEFKRISLREVRDMRDRSSKTVYGPNHQKTEEANPEKLRKILAEECLVGWEGLTGEIAFAMCARQCPRESARAVVGPSVQNKLTMLTYARGVVDGQQTTFEGWLWERVNATAVERHETEAAEKKI